VGHLRRLTQPAATSAITPNADISLAASSDAMGHFETHAPQHNRGTFSGKFCHAERSTRTSIST